MPRRSKADSEGKISDASASLQLLIETLEGVGGAESAPVCFGKTEDGQCFRALKMEN